MGICWYCHWGWAEKVAEIFVEAEKELGDYYWLELGPGFRVWADENFDDYNVSWCIEHFNENADEMTERERKIVLNSLQKLLEIPEEERDVCPRNYNGENPQDFPPKIKTVFTHELQ